VLKFNDGGQYVTGVNVELELCVEWSDVNTIHKYLQIAKLNSNSDELVVKINNP
jgi:hypothetical protein